MEQFSQKKINLEMLQNGGQFISTQCVVRGCHKQKSSESLSQTISHSTCTAPMADKLPPVGAVQETVTGFCETLEISNGHVST